MPASLKRTWVVVEVPVLLAVLASVVRLVSRSAIAESDLLIAFLSNHAELPFGIYAILVKVCQIK
jgi:hypothetical protein